MQVELDAISAFAAMTWEIIDRLWIFFRADHANYRGALIDSKVNPDCDAQTMRSRLLLAPCWLCLLACEPSFDDYSASEAVPRTTSSWSSYGGPGGRKFAPVEEIDRRNVGDLEPAWVYRTGDLADVFQATPVLVEGQLVFCSPFNKLIALDPSTGGELWAFDPEIDRALRPANEFNCRAVSPWQGNSSDECAPRIFMATNDSRLIAVDAASGAPCTDFGRSGEVDLSEGVGGLLWAGEYQVTSPPAVTDDAVIVGSAISDGNRVHAPSGVVRAFDPRTGKLLWAFDLAPPDFDYANSPTSERGYALGTPNVWSAMSVDEERDMVFLPTGNPSPDYARTGEVDMAYYGSSVVALRASTGEVLWHFNTVIKDFWDFDVPSQPVLADLRIGGEVVPTVIQATKMGHVFVLHRETGEPVVDVTYRDVPRSGPMKDQMSPVQPFPPEAFQLSRSYVKGDSVLGLCDDLDATSTTGPVFTPIGEQWIIGLPSNMGSTNWGGLAVDEARGLIAVNTNSVPFRTKLIARADAVDLLRILEDPASSPEARRDARREFDERFDLPPGAELAPQHGTDYLMSRHVYLDPLVGIPCGGLPLAEMMVIDVDARTQTWRRPHGTVRDMAFLPLSWGAPGMGGPLITASGLVFIGGASEKALRAYDLETGAELWSHRLPNPANATPMSYVVERIEGDKQFVVVAAGGDARAGIGGQGDYLIGFALPD
jgi:quinoprotein glucose dehydrogenase